GGDGVGQPLSSTDISDANTGAFKAGPVMLAGRSSHTATLLADGRVLVVGGQGATGILNTVEVLDAAATSFAAGPPLTTARSAHTATLLADGRVLIVGGADSGFTPLKTAEVFDPLANNGAGGWSSPIPLGAARFGHQATLLPDSRVLITGGGSQTAESFDPAT